MLEAAFGGMGSEIVVRTDGHERLGAARSEFEAIEAAASRFRPDSELSRLNRDPRRLIPIDGVLAAILSTAAELRDRTAGLIDPAVGEAVAAWGYDRDFASVSDLRQAPAARPTPTWSIRDGRVERDPGVVLDLGGVAKGWACDHVVAGELARLASAGGDMRSADPDLTVEVIDPWGETAATMHVGLGALATSSVTRRTWLAGERRAHHIIDPRSGAPAETPVLTASVIAGTAAEAEAGAKAVLLLGAEGLAWADAQPWIREALAVWQDGSVYGTRRAA